MAEYGVGALLVICERRLLGIVSERDYARKVILKGAFLQGNLGQRGHDDACSRHLPVLEDDSAVGVVSIGNLVNRIISGRAQTIPELEGHITGAYPS